MKQKDQRTEDGEELANKGPFARPLSRGLRLMGEASGRTQGAAGPSFSSGAWRKERPRKPRGGLQPH